MKLVCQYAIARFLPYPETGEFANFGIVAFCPQTNFFGFKLLTRRIGRITAFFAELKPDVYRRARLTLQDELQRIQAIMHKGIASVGRADGIGERLFGELIRPRESAIRFSDRRAIMTEDPAIEIDRLYDHYVGRGFVTTEYQERLAERAIGRLLEDIGLREQFTRQNFAVAGYHATFPFVRRQHEQVTQVIKPLNLGQNDGAQIYNHGWQWVGSIRRLRELGALTGDILLPVKGPTTNDAEVIAQFNAVTDRLREANATVVPIEDEQAIKSFARA